ncbi:BACON domain-containing protein [Chromobacterium paludis]|uniref:BACON domain-containing protein n=1 Tax=Chromobacterium paludis TaxID=2605945 RepID=A0A5C1DCD1_9NEIS|nr:hypothetical protein [Chromobacterium paludis]QEL54334.1 hypothetical protein FYK34_01440 [Chromobacterium paludis]
MLLLASMLSACGGGGGGGGGEGPSQSQAAMPPSSIQLSTPSLGGNQTVGSSQTWTIQASVADPSKFNGTIYLYVVDNQHVLGGSPQLNWLGGNQMALTLHSSGTLAAGHYKGALQFQLCRDAQCGSAYLSAPLSLPYDFTVAELPLQTVLSGLSSTTVYVGGDNSFSSSVAVSGPSGKWTASSKSPWLVVNKGAGQGAGSFTVTMATKPLAAGTYTDNVTVSSEDGQTAVLPFSVNVRPVQFVASQDSFSFSGINGGDIPAQTLRLSLNNDGQRAWSASSNAGWLQAGAVSGTTPSNIPLFVDPSRGALASGNYSGTLHLNADAIDSKDIAASLALSKASFTLPTQGIVLGGDKGRDPITPQNLQFALNTGNKSWPWRVASQPAWLKTNAAGGNVSQVAMQALQLSSDFSQAKVGTTTDALKLSSQINGDTVEGTVPVTINRDQRRLLPSKWGVAFSSTPAGKVLSKTLTIKDNFGGVLNWTASSDASWLKVTASGQTSSGSTLQLQADDSQLPMGQISYANVTISADAVDISPAVVRVAVWRDSQSLSNSVTLNGNYKHMVADPIRPLVYVGGVDGSVLVFNAYSATQVAVIPGVVAATGEMTVSPNGDYLYVLDTVNRAMAVVDLTALKKTNSWNLINAVSDSTPLLAIRPNGVELVLLGDGTAYKAGKSFAATGIQGYTLTATDDGRSVYSIDTGMSPASMAGYNVDYSEIASGSLLVSIKPGHWDWGNSSNGKSISVSGDGASLYTASGSPYRCLKVDPVSLDYVGQLPGGDSYPIDVLVLTDGRVLCGANSGSLGETLWLHNKNGGLIKSYGVWSQNYANLSEHGLVALGDSIIMAAMTARWTGTSAGYANALVFLPI